VNDELVKTWEEDVLAYLRRHLGNLSVGTDKNQENTKENWRPG
jgi:hypothetical protein